MRSRVSSGLVLYTVLRNGSFPLPDDVLTWDSERLETADYKYSYGTVPFQEYTQEIGGD